MNTTSASLLDRLHSNTDPTTWDRFNDIYSPLIRGWLKRRGIRPDDADDLIQEVLLVVVRQFPKFVHNTRTGAFRSWLRTIVVNVSRDFWKKNRLRPAAPGGEGFGGYLDQLADPSHDQSAEWDREHDLFVVRRLLELIEPEFEAATWEAFRRFALNGEPAATVAAALGTTPNAVFIAKSRILTRLNEEARGLINDE